MYVHLVFCLIAHKLGDLKLGVPPLLLPSFQMARPINKAIKKFILENYVECDNHYIYNLFKDFPFCESVLVIMFSAYD